MIVRIVRMHFRPAEIAVFQTLFDARKGVIRNMPGCMHLELWQDGADPSIFFTYSTWESEQHLAAYRFSGFFRETWALTKALFSAKAEAWSVSRLVVLD